MYALNSYLVAVLQYQLVLTEESSKIWYTWLQKNQETFPNNYAKTKENPFANKHKAWNFSQWENVVFSDESIFRSYSAHGKHWVLRTANNKGKPEHMHETMSHGS